MTRRRFGNIVKRDNGKYLCRWTDIHGKQKSKMITGTKADAESFLESVEMRMYGADRDVTYREYWENFVLPQIETLEEKTKNEYKRVWGKHLEGPLSARYVASTNYRFAQTIIDGIDAPSQQRRVASLWKKICNMAVRDGILDFCPIQRMQYKPMIRREKTILPRNMVIGHVQDSMESKFAHLVVLEMMAGLRHEEACAITEEDITERDGFAIVSVSKARVVVNGRMIEKDTKNSVSLRSVPLYGACADALLRCSVKHVNPETATRNYRKWCERNDKQYVRFGDMRSNFATHAGECCDGSLVNIYMGHSGFTTTDRWYRSRTDEGMEIVAKSYAEYIAT